MSDKDKKVDELLEHNYDGIEEYDNDLPLWWQWLFWGTAIFGVVYVLYYHVGPGLNQEETLALEMEQAEKQKAWVEGSAEKDEDQEAELKAMLGDENRISAGAKIFQGKCMSCHGMYGEGLVGPNLTDNYWIHGGTLKEIKYTIENGVLEKGMLAWKTTMSQDDIEDVTVFVWTLNGKNPPNAKPQEGTLVERK